jgi:glucose-1-phosphate adenylyltransferase
MNYMELISYHREKKADVTVSAMPVPEKEVKEFGILKMSAEGRIISFKEKPKKRSELRGCKFASKKSFFNQSISGSHYLASMGVYVFNADALMEALAGNDTDFGKEVMPHSVKNLRGFGYVFNGYWKDVGTIKAFYDVNMGMAASNAQFSFFYEGSVFTRPRFLPSARIFNSNIKNSLISEGSVIRDADIKNSIVGLRSIVGKNCRISRTVLMGADYYEDNDLKEALAIGIGDRTFIDKTIVDKNASIGRDVVIRNIKNMKNFDGENYYIRDGIVIIPKNAIIKPGTRI